MTVEDYYSYKNGSKRIAPVTDRPQYCAWIGLAGEVIIIICTLSKNITVDSPSYLENRNTSFQRKETSEIGRKGQL